MKTFICPLPPRRSFPISFDDIAVMIMKSRNKTRSFVRSMIIFSACDRIKNSRELRETCKAKVNEIHVLGNSGR